jgi:hypothetical protein
MLQEALTNPLWLGWIPDLGVLSYLPGETVSIAVIFSALGAIILGRFTGNLGVFTFPFNYTALFVAAIVSNWLLSDIRLPVDHTIQAPFLFSVVGMTIAALSMMALIRQE